MHPDTRERAVTTPSGGWYRISEVAHRTGLTPSTIRFYEREFGFFVKSHRTSGGHRRYDEEAIRRLLYLKYLIQNKGLSIREVQRRLLRGEDYATLRREVAALHEAVEILMRELHQLKQYIHQLQERVHLLEQERSARGIKRWLR